MHVRGKQSHATKRTLPSVTPTNAHTHTHSHTLCPALSCIIQRVAGWADASSPGGPIMPSLG